MNSITGRPPTATRLRCFSKRRNCRTTSIRSTSATAISSRRRSSRSRRTTGSRPSSTPTPRAAAHRSAFSSPAPSWNISPTRPDISFPPRPVRGPRPCNGFTGRWAASAPWPARTTISCNMRRSAFPMPWSAMSTRPTVSTACSTSNLPVGSFVAGDYSIADMAIYPWIVPHERQATGSGDVSQPQALVPRNQSPARR